MKCAQLLDMEPHPQDHFSPRVSSCAGNSPRSSNREAEPDGGQEVDFETPPSLRRLHIREARLRYYNADLQTPEGRAELISEIEFLREEVNEISGDKIGSQESPRQQLDGQLNLRHFGCESEWDRQSEYDDTICAEADLSETQARALILSLEGKTQPEIAWRLKKPQHVVEEAIQTAREKFLTAQRNAGGPHMSDLFRLVHYSDTHGYTEWSRRFSAENGHPPCHCRLCPAEMGNWQ